MKGLTRAAILCIACLLTLAAAWTKEDHEIFRLRDEVQASEGSNQTFYSFLGIRPGANNDDINKAYRKLSRTLHPDKARSNWIANYNKPPKTKSKPGAKPAVHVHKNKQPSQSEVNRFNKEASARFERLSLVANILRGPERERYDHFLANGFPTWRGTGYYYERFRPGLGTVLIGLFVAVGGAGHYVTLYVSWKRRREFVERYIKHARRMAWGDEGGIGAIPGLGGSTSQVQRQATPDTDESMQWNRKQKRAMEREKRKESKAPPVKNAKAAKTAREEGVSTPVEAEITSGPVGAKKRTVAENGKVLIVDSVGNVFLEDETEEGDRQEFLLDVCCPSTIHTLIDAHSLTSYTARRSPPTDHPRHLPLPRPHSPLQPHHRPLHQQTDTRAHRLGGRRRQQ
jgi:curved DNA-binding protein CbpA